MNGLINFDELEDNYDYFGLKGQKTAEEDMLHLLPDDTPEAKEELAKAVELIKKARECMKNLDGFGAIDCLGDAQFIREKYYPEEHDLRKEIIILLEQSTFL